MIEVEEMFEGIRGVGLNYGLPMFTVVLGKGEPYSSEQLMSKIVLETKCKWICIEAQSLDLGLGTLAKSLSQAKLLLEFECSGTERTPSWIHFTDRWMVEYVADGAFNYLSLRNTDMILFRIESIQDLEVAGVFFETLGLFPGTKCLDVPYSLFHEALELARKYDRTRVYVR